MNFGEQLLNLRKSKNLSQEELANKIGVTRQTISKWELGDTTPDLKQLDILTKVFDVSMNELTNNYKGNEIINEKIISNKIFRLLLVIIIGIIILCILYNTGYNNGLNNIRKYSNIDVTCTINNQNNYFKISYQNDNGIVSSMSGSTYLINSLYGDREDVTVVEMVNALNEYFVSNGGSCK